MKPKTKELVFNAIPLWEVIVAFFVMFILIYGISEYIIAPLTLGNTVMQTQFIIFILLIFLLLEYLFHFKRSKPINFKINESQNVLSLKLLNKQINLVDMKNMDIVKFIHKKSFSYTLIVNNNIYLIYKKEAMIKKLSKEEAKIYQDNIAAIKKISEDNNLNRKTILRYIPKAINIGFYLIVIIALSLGIFLFGAIFTDNTQLFDYFKY